jgi:hypothetical protein
MIYCEFCHNQCALSDYKTHRVYLSMTLVSQGSSFIFDLHFLGELS